MNLLSAFSQRAGVFALQCAGRERIASERAVDEMNVVAAKRRRREAGHHRPVLLVYPVADDAGVGGRGQPRLDGARGRGSAVEHHAQGVVVLAEVRVVLQLTKIGRWYKRANPDVETKNAIGERSRDQDGEAAQYERTAGAAGRAHFELKTLGRPAQPACPIRNRT